MSCDREHCSESDQQCYAEPDSRSRWQRLKNKLFPAKYCPVPTCDFQYNDCIVGCAVTKLDFIDRLRVLFTGVVVVDWKTLTENGVGRTASIATCYIGTSDNTMR